MNSKYVCSLNTATCFGRLGHLQVLLSVLGTYEDNREVWSLYKDLNNEYIYDL